MAQRPSMVRFTGIVVVAALVAWITVLATASANAEDGLVLAFTQQPDGASGGESFTDQPVVTVQDPDGQTVDVVTQIDLALVGGPDGASFDCAPVDTVAGVATFSGCRIDLAGSGYRLEATASGVESATSDPFDVAVGDPVALRFTAQPNDIVAGTPFAPAPAIELRDAGGNPVVPAGFSLGLIAVTEDGAPVSLTGCTGGRQVVDQGATFHSIDPADGDTQAVFDGCTVARAGIGFSLLGVAVPDDETADSLIGYSDTFDTFGGAPTRVVFTTQPGGAVSGQPLTRQPTLAIQDAAGNIVPADPGADVGIALLPVPTPAGVEVSLNCPDGNRAAFVGGVAAFDSCSIDANHAPVFAGDGHWGAASGPAPLPESEFVLRATAGSFMVESAPFGPAVRSGATGGDVESLRFLVQPGDGTGGAPLTAQPVVEVLDEDGVGVAASVELSLAGDPAGAELTCPNAIAPAPRGVATFIGCSVDRAGTYQFVATDPETGISVESEPFDIAVGEPAQLALTGPGEAIAGTPFTAEVEVRDAGGNAVTTADAPIRLALASGGASSGGWLSCPDRGTAVPVAGVASFTDCTIDRPGDYRLIAVGDVGVAASVEFQVLTGPPAAVEFLSAPESAIAGGTLASPRVKVEDAGGNPLDAVVGLGVVGGSLAGCDTAVTAEHGIAVFPGCVLQTSGSSISISASAGAASATAVVPVSHDAPIGVSAVAVPLAQTFGGDDYANNPTFVNNDVNAATGALSFSNEDITVAGIGMPFVLTRTYNSADETGGWFGPGWSSIFDAGVTFDADGNAVVRGEDGQQLVFAKEAGCKRQCELLAPPGATSELACKRQTCTVTRFDGVSFTSTDGRIERYEARTGHGLGFEYDRDGALTGVTVTTSDDPLTVHVTTEDGRITSVNTPTRSSTYGYTGGVLTAFTDPTGNTTTYEHSAGLLTERRLGGERLLVGYGPDGRVVSAATSGQQRRYADTYAWSDDGAGTVTSTRRSAVEAYGQPAEAVHIERYQGNALVSEQLANGATQWYSFDENANLVSFQDALGGVQRSTFDAAGDLVATTASDGGTVTFSYDDEHRATSVTDQLGNTTEFHYAGANVQRVVPPDPDDPANQPGAAGEVGTFLNYDSFDRLVEVKTPTAYRTYTYDRSGNQTGFQVFDRADVDRLSPLNGQGPLRRFDEAGNVTNSVDPRGHRADGSVDPTYETTYSYDANGRVVQTRNPAGDTMTTTYTPTGEISSTTDAHGDTTTYAWDEATRTRTATGGTAGTWVFDPTGNLVSFTDDADRTTTTVHDHVGLVVAETDPAGVTSRQFHDLAGNVVEVDDEIGVVVVTYRHGRSVRTVMDGVETSSTEYDLAGNVISSTDADGQVTTYTYDNHGQLESVTDGAGTTSYTYDHSENLASVTDGNGNTTTYANDGAGQRVAKTLGTSTWTYAYDVAGNLVTTTDPDERTTSYTIDPAGRRTGVTHSQPGRQTIGITQSFDAEGRRVGLTDPTGSHSFGYDDDGNLTSVDGPTGTFTYDYSTPGERTDTYPDGTTVSYGYDDGGGLMTLEAPGVRVAYTRNSSRQVTGIATGNGLFETFGYDADGRLVSQDLRCGTDPVMTTRYGHDASSSPLGTLRAVGGQTVITGYGYDGTGRLVAERFDVAGDSALPGDECASSTPVPTPIPAPPGETDPTLTPPPEVNDPLPAEGLSGLVPATENPITYDPVGNRTSAGGVAYTYDDADRLVSGSDGRVATYDGAGNLTSSTVGGETTTYAYDAAGRLAEVELPDGRTITYTHDGDGLRVGKSIDGAPATTFAWDRSGELPLLALESEPSGEFRRYFYGVGPVAVQTQSETFYLHADRRNDITAVSDASGAIVSTYAYDAFGNRTEATSSQAPTIPLGFGGQYLDEDSGLYYLRARDYDPALGRFTQRDPVTLPIGVPVVSPYVYADNQPTVLADATGLIASPIPDIGHSTETANTVEAAKRGTAIGRFVGTKVLPKTLANPKVFAGLTKYTRSVTGALDAVDDTAKAASKAGKFLAVAGVALSAYLVYEDCTSGTTAQCVGSSIALAFNVGCLAVSGGAATVLCTVAGIGLSYVATNYGPEIAEFTKETYNSNNAFNAAFSAAIGVVVTAACIGATLGTLTGLCVVAGVSLAVLLAATVDFEQGFIDFGDVLATGFNDLGSAIASGFDAAGRVILQAGVELAKVIALLGDTFSQTAEQVVAQLVDFGLDVRDFGVEVADFFASTPALAIALFRDLGYEVTAVAAVVDAAFDDVADWSATALASALASAGYAFEAVYGGLSAAYDVAAEEFASIVRDINYTAVQIAAGLEDAYGYTAEQFAALGTLLDFTASEIAAGLQDAYESTAAAVAQTLRDLGFAAEVIGAAVEDAFAAVAGWSQQALADAFMAAGFAADEIARGLQGAYDAAAAEVADLLLDFGFAVNEVSAALQSAYATSAEAITEILVDLGVAATLIADTLIEVYGQAESAVKDLLEGAGAALEDLGDFFGDLGNDIADTLNPLNW